MESTETLALVVAALAVFVGPLVAWRVTKLQIQASFHAANKQTIGPMRRQWIESLLDLIAELSSEAQHLYVAGVDDDTEEGSTELVGRFRRMMFLEQKIRLMLSPPESDHQELLDQIRKLVIAAESPSYASKDFSEAHDSVTDLSRRVFKREWHRVRHEL